MFSKAGIKHWEKNVSNLIFETFSCLCVWLTNQKPPLKSFCPRWQQTVSSVNWSSSTDNKQSFCLRFSSEAFTAVMINQWKSRRQSGLHRNFVGFIRSFHLLQMPKCFRSDKVRADLQCLAFWKQCWHPLICCWRKSLYTKWVLFSLSVTFFKKQIFHLCSAKQRRARSESSERVRLDPRIL